MAKRWYASGIKFACTEGGDCCHNHGEYDSVYFTRAEAHAVARALDVSITDLLRHHLKREDGYLVARSRRGACVFLRGCSCSIYAQRPVPCSTWPFWPDLLEKRAWKRDVVTFCKGVGSGERVSGADIDATAAEKATHDRTVDAERES
jgi:Fe-S-cluster containining protein